jgi:hypothetical protein
MSAAIIPFPAGRIVRRLGNELAARREAIPFGIGVHAYEQALDLIECGCPPRRAARIATGLAGLPVRRPNFWIVGGAA